MFKDRKNQFISSSLHRGSSKHKSKTKARIKYTYEIRDLRESDFNFLPDGRMELFIDYDYRGIKFSGKFVCLQSNFLELINSKISSIVIVKKSNIISLNMTVMSKNLIENGLLAIPSTEERYSLSSKSKSPYYEYKFIVSANRGVLKDLLWGINLPVKPPKKLPDCYGKKKYSYYWSCP